MLQNHFCSFSHLFERQFSFGTWDGMFQILLSSTGLEPNHPCDCSSKFGPIRVIFNKSFNITNSCCIYCDFFLDLGVIFSNIYDFVWRFLWPLGWVLKQEIRSLQPKLQFFSIACSDASWSYISRVWCRTDIMPLIRSCPPMNLTETISNKGLETTWFVTYIPQDNCRICPEVSLCKLNF